MLDSSIPAWQITADLVRLRRSAISVLNGDANHFPDVPQQSVDLFLKLERCANTLADRLAIPSEPIRAAAVRESQSGLRAQVDAIDLEQIASSTGTPVIVLKGGVHVLRRQRPILPLADIDILVSSASVDRILDQLESREMGARARRIPRHQALIPAEGRISIEVHWNLQNDDSPVDPELWNRARPLKEQSALLRLGAVDHLVHLLRHAIVFHASNSVTLRDTILIGEAAAECTPGELREVRRVIAREDPAHDMGSLLSFATDLRNGQVTIDPFERSSVTSYAAAVLASRLPGILASAPALSFAVERELGRIPLSRSLRVASTFFGTANETLSHFADDNPRLAAAILGPAHLIYHTAVSAAVRPRIRATAKKALESLG